MAHRLPGGCADVGCRRRWQEFLPTPLMLTVIALSSCLAVLSTHSCRERDEQILA
jgi:hypothetical protein